MEWWGLVFKAHLNTLAMSPGSPAAGFVTGMPRMAGRNPKFVLRNGVN